ncbi:hypothetical protein B0H14DRAFT_3483094 [Mycena olivaceomarginata]|nr:hypothetical protein B0H14DRAFT_3483094 [Mycena olivaceomarginata]
MSRQFFLTLVLRLIKYLFGVILIPVPEPPPTPLDNEEEGCNSHWLLFLQTPSDDPWAQADPIYFARTFEDALKYLPLCEAFQDAFALDEAGRFLNTKPFYYAVDNDGEVYYTSEAAKEACKRQPDYGVICVMTSKRAAQARTDGWPDDYIY